MAAPAGEGFRKKYYRERILALLGILLLVSLWRFVVMSDESRPVDWSYKHDVLVCTLVAAGADVKPLESALDSAPESLGNWMAEQRDTWGQGDGQPIRFAFARPVEVDGVPPRLPPPDASWLTRLRGTRAFLRWFTSKSELFPEPGPDGTRLYLLLHAASEADRFDDVHSVATRRGKLAIVFAPDDPEQWGNTEALIAHEVLHTVGALDHREADGTIAHPAGYADPTASPLFPQEQAEVMALGIPVSPTKELRVTALEEVVVGRATAGEIGWLEADE